MLPSCGNKWKCVISLQLFQDLSHFYTHYLYKHCRSQNMQKKNKLLSSRYIPFKIQRTCMNWFLFSHECLTNLRLTMQWPHPVVSPDNDVSSLLMTSFTSVCTGSLHIHVAFLPSFKLKTPDIWRLSHFSCVNSTAHRSSHSICRAHNIHHLMTVPLGTQTAWNNSLFTAVIARESVQKSLLLLRRLFQRSGFEFWISLSFFFFFF